MRQYKNSKNSNSRSSVIKQCTKCKEHLPDNLFGSQKRVDVNNSTYWTPRSRCRKCVSEENLIRLKTKTSTQEAHAKASYRHRIKSYGITVEAYEKLLEEQNNACAICKTIPEKKLNIDHSHMTGKVRSLLCHNCNTALGHANDSIERLELLIEYLKKHGN